MEAKTKSGSFVTESCGLTLKSLITRFFKFKENDNLAIVCVFKFNKPDKTSSQARVEIYIRNQESKKTRKNDDCQKNISFLIVFLVAFVR